MSGAQATRAADVGRQAARRHRFKLRDELYTASSLHRVQWCGRRRTGQQVSVVSGLRGAGFTGVAYCSSMWSCPVCSAVIRQRRAGELEAAVTPFLLAGGSGLLLTLTIPHSFEDSLQTTFGIVRDGWAKLRRNSAAQSAWERAGVVGSIKAVEITRGRNGWHPHLHVLILTQAPVVGAQLEDFTAAVQAAWIAGATPPGRSAPSAEFGVNIQTLHVRGRLDQGRLVRYLAKVQDAAGQARGVGLEMTRGDLKRGRKTSSTPFELLEQLRAARLAGRGRRYRHLAGLWREYEQVTRGRHGILWSRGLKARLGLRDVTDEQLVDQSQNEGAEAILHMDPFAWTAVCRASARSQLLDLAEAGDQLGMVRLVRALLEAERAEHEAVWAELQPDAAGLDDTG
ncbi:MAG: hypothetical protein QOI54_1834 [Actinomycetota bacterium]|nr:hypothetical protein [Actinomycetota bacterium]